MQYDLKYQVVISDVKLQINPLMFVSGWKWLRGIKMAPFLFLLCCEKKSVSMKKKPDEKIKKTEIRDEHTDSFSFTRL